MSASLSVLHRLPRVSVSSLGISWPLLVAVAVCVVYLSGSTTQIFGDPDTYLHLAAGDWIFRHLSVPGVDPFSYTLGGAPWVAHEWLSQCLLAAAYHLGGWTGLVLLTVTGFALTLAYLLRFLLARVPPIYAVFFTALALFALAPHLLARPHVLAWPILALWLGSLVNASEKKQSPPWWLLGLMVLWANLHGSFTLGLALVLPIALEAVLDSPRAGRVSVLKNWGLFFGLAVLAAMLTPAGWKGLWFTFQLLNLKYLNRISEWMPSGSVAGLISLEFWLMVLLGLALTGYLRLPIIRLLLVLGLLYQALAHARYVSLFGLLVPILIAAPFGKLYASLSVGKPQASALDRFFDKLAVPARPLTVACAVVLVLLTGLIASWGGRHVPAASVTPAAAVDAALRAGVSGHVLNHYSFGGYLIYRKIPVFVDGRADLYGDRHLDAYVDAVESNKPEKIRKVLDDFKISWTLLHPDAPVLLYLNTQPEWQKIYEDETAAVHVRRGVTH
jgi:hypothetical protein